VQPILAANRADGVRLASSALYGFNYRPASPGVFCNRVAHYGVFMNITLSLGPLVSLIAGILILIMPRLLSYIVALYLIIIGIIGIMGVGSSHF
jgi:hypothetical protein